MEDRIFKTIHIVVEVRDEAQIMRAGAEAKAAAAAPLHPDEALAPPPATIEEAISAVMYTAIAHENLGLAVREISVTPREGDLEWEPPELVAAEEGAER